MMKKMLAMAAIAALAAVSATAATVTKISDAPAAWGMLDLGATVTLPSGATWTVAPTVTENNQTGQRSPFDPSGGALTGWETIDYFAVGPAHATTQAVLSFDRVQTGLGLLWGSPDSYNSIVLVNNAEGGSETVLSSAIVPGPTAPAGRGAVLVDISGVRFDEARFLSSSNAFEFASVTATPVPLPAAGWMLIAAMSGLAYLRRRTQR